MTNEERIKADARAATDKRYPGDAVNFEYIEYEEGYIAGATAVHDRAQVLVDALEAIMNTGWQNYQAHEISKIALEQWKSGNGKEVVQVKDESIAPQPDLGTCKECKKRPAVTDYNGHGYYVCQLCDNSLNRAFDEEYR